MTDVNHGDTEAQRTHGTEKDKPHFYSDPCFLCVSVPLWFTAVIQ